MYGKSPRSNLKTPEKKSNKHVTWKESSASNSREFTPRREANPISARFSPSPRSSERPLKQSPKSPSRVLKRSQSTTKLSVKKPRVERFSDPAEGLFKATTFFRRIHNVFRDKKQGIVTFYERIQREIATWKDTEDKVYDFEVQLKQVNTNLSGLEVGMKSKREEYEEFTRTMVASVDAVVKRVNDLILENVDITKPQVIIVD
ncbi:unnamed protein product [Bursaphelenchus okinawaensis]|uniref:Uncharacterized protein n=1 Tax=Bursaphelenchus okinawaensis TaxID=465554 RepID=A0A811K7N3_9BILA|nr:unnamed protein product [Bursaphelenchus okinawaensis]CAG9094224.1 unnamed protein product [Bursaphelenchus okinawaensis]